MIKNTFHIIIFGLLLAAVNHALAQEAKYELDYMLVDSTLGNNKYQPNAAQLKYIIPYTQNFEFEGVLGFGAGVESAHFKYQLATDYTQHFRLTDLVGLYIKAHAEIEPKVLAFAHAGLVRMEYNISSSLSQIKPDGTVTQLGLGYGIGISMNLFEHSSFVLNFDHFPEAKSDGVKIRSTALSIGYQSTF